MGGIFLAPLTSETLPVVSARFEDEETRRWLGGPGWPEIVLRLASDRVIAGAR